MNIQGLDYNTTRDHLQLMAYGRNIQQMVEACVALPSKQQRQHAAEQIIAIMQRAVPSTQSQRERRNVLWYHLALMSNFQLDIDYPVEIAQHDKMAKQPERIPYATRQRIPARHYGRLLSTIFDELQTMPEGKQRDTLAQITAAQMFRNLTNWGMRTADREKVVSDLAALTNGKIQLDPRCLKFDSAQTSNKKKKKKR